jgi:hypothetical protein
MSTPTPYATNNPYSGHKTYQKKTRCVSHYMADFGGGYMPYMIEAVNDESIVDYLSMLASPLFSGNPCTTSLRFDFNGTVINPVVLDSKGSVQSIKGGDFTRRDFIYEPIIVDKNNNPIVSLNTLQGTIFPNGIFVCVVNGTAVSSIKEGDIVTIQLSGSLALNNTSLSLNGKGFYCGDDVEADTAFSFNVSGHAGLSFNPSDQSSPPRALLGFKLIAVLANGFSLPYNVVKGNDTFINTALQSIVNMMPNTLKGLTASYTLTLKS